MPGEHNRRTIKFPEDGAPSLVVEITNLKANENADEIAQMLAEKVAEWVPMMVLGKMAPQIIIK